MKKIKWGKFSGLRIRGKTPIIPEHQTHLEVASFVTSRVESGGCYGTVINYDGTGMTAGIHQAIAVYPRGLNKGAKTSQGPLWKLLSRMFVIPPGIISLIEIVDLLHDAGMTISADGHLRYEVSGKYVHGEAIRTELGTPKGILAGDRVTRARAERYINLFHQLFSDPLSYAAQERYGQEHFIKSSARHKMRFSRIPRTTMKTLDTAIYEPLTGKPLAVGFPTDMNPELNLAMCMFWCYYVNAPGMAMKKVCQVYDRMDKRNRSWGELFPAALIRSLGTSSYGRWDDDIDNGRYQRTRKECMKAFGKQYFSGKGAIMPKDFPGA